jgi:hypothetical protein
MTKEQALQIPELQITPNDLVEDCFYYKLAKAGRLSEEHGSKALERLQGKEDDPCYKGAFIVADMMIANLDKYGVPCAAWAE